MLTRLRVSGFKNLVDVDVRFGPFTCIAGANGTGKSNLFDAIHFLSALSDRPLLDAALGVRDEGARAGDVRNLFHRVGDRYDDELSFQAEMIVPSEGEDELGQTARATITFLRYSLVLGYRGDAARTGPSALEVIKEELSHIKQKDAPRHLLFPHTVKTWRRSAVKGRRTTPYFISTAEEGGSRVIKLHQDGGTSGRPLLRSATNLPRTVLSAVNAAESPTATLARREMQSWRLLQLEPSSLRRPDPFTAPTTLASDGAHLAATLYHLARLGPPEEVGAQDPGAAASALYMQVANRLSELIDDVHAVAVDRDEKRELLTLTVTDRNNTSHPAMALSDGTLRFLALAVLELDPDATGVICLEEPENGIHPERIPAMLQLLQDIATDPDEQTGPDNPLRQVIVNTHSPAVVRQVPDGSLVIAELKEIVRGDERVKCARFSCLPDSWRSRADGTPVVAKGKLLAYLNPVAPPSEQERSATRTKRARRVVDRPDIQRYLFPPDEWM